MTNVVAIVAAASECNNGIGHDNQLPWKLSGDMKHFKDVTTTTISPAKKNAVIMGRKTWESIPKKFRPLDNRINVVLTSNKEYNADDNKDVIIASSLEEATKKILVNEGEIDQIFVIGGEKVYKESIDSGLVNRVYLTEVTNVPSDQKFDAFFPQLNEKEWESKPFVIAKSLDKENDNNSSNNNSDRDKSSSIQTDTKSGLQYQFLEYVRKQQPAAPSASATVDIKEGADVNPEEMQYLNMCRDILETGALKGDRTGTGTISKFGTTMRFSLRDNTMPLLTTKRTFWRGVAEELLWFISGSTNGNLLSERDIHIWDGNGSREFLDSRGLSHREVGDLGPVYGFQWRHFGAKYTDMHADYTGQGVDQLADVIDKIKNNPNDRRIIMSAWNPSDLDTMALPPCHMFCQFYVDTAKNELSCQMYQRSADMGLGVPFNIASYALLTHMIAHVTGRKAGDFVHVIGDAHVYSNHVDALKEQIERKPREFPKLVIKKQTDDIDSFTYDDFEIVGYKPHKTIKMKMAV